MPLHAESATKSEKTYPRCPGITETNSDTGLIRTLKRISRPASSDTHARAVRLGFKRHHAGAIKDCREAFPCV